MANRSVRHLGACVALASVLVAGCAAGLQVHSFTDTGSRVSKYRTFAFGPANLSATGNPRLDDNRFFIERVQQNVDQQLVEHGYTRTSPRAADLIVHYHASVRQELELNDAPRPDCYYATANGSPTGTTHTPPVNCRPYIYDAGTLLVDLVDRQSRKVVWRGWAEGSIDGVLENQKWMEERVDQAVTKIMAQLPRHAPSAAN